jgi:signal transduction histidine kinase
MTVPEMPGPARHSASLHRRAVAVAVSLSLAVALLVFVPGLTRGRLEYLWERGAAADLVMRAAPHAAPAEAAVLLGLAQVRTARLQSADEALIQWRDSAPFNAPGLVDLRHESLWKAIAAAFDVFTDPGDTGMLVTEISRHDAECIVSVGIDAKSLSAHLRSIAGRLALAALLLGALTGLLAYGMILFELIRPVRRFAAQMHAGEAGTAALPSDLAAAAAALGELRGSLREAAWLKARVAAMSSAVSKVNHDLRGLLSPAYLAAERLSGHADAAVSRSAETVASAIERATLMAKRALEFNCEQPRPRERVALRALVEQAAGTARATRPGIEVENRVPSDLVLMTDRAHLLDVMTHLLRNAAEAGAPSVAVTAEDTGETIAITVADSGPGLSPQVQHGLFRPLAQGGGMGLAIAHDLSRAHGGTLALVSTGPGGTSFRLTLPQTQSTLFR